MIVYQVGNYEDLYRTKADAKRAIGTLGYPIHKRNFKLIYIVVVVGSMPQRCSYFDNYKKALKASDNTPRSIFIRRVR